MIVPTMGDEFAMAFRQRLIAQVGQAGRKRRRLLAGLGLSTVLLLGGTAAAAATGLLVLPGATETTGLGDIRTLSTTGTGRVDLGPRPAETNGVALSLTCLSTGTFTFDDGASLTCSSSSDLASTATSVLPLSAIDGNVVTIVAGAGEAWTLTAQYARSVTTEWAVNEDGHTFGAMNEGSGPDLIAAVATNGRQGYVRRDDLEEANGTTASQEFTSPEDALRWQEQNAGKTIFIPVYESDGTTVIGEFQIGG
jgi:hypothetical protein